MKGLKGEVQENGLWVKPRPNKFVHPSIGQEVDSIINKPSTSRKILKSTQRQKIIENLIKCSTGFNSLGDIQEIETKIKEIEYNLSSYKENYSAKEDMLGYFKIAILKGKDRIIMISLDKIENLLKSIGKNNLTEQEIKELNKHIENCRHITEIEHPQKIDIYIEKLERIGSLVKETYIEDYLIRKLQFESNQKKSLLALEQDSKENF